MHNFVYLAPRRSQEFSFEPNFGGGGVPPPPLAAPLVAVGVHAVARENSLCQRHFQLCAWLAKECVHCTALNKKKFKEHGTLIGGLSKTMFTQARLHVAMVHAVLKMQENF